MTTATERYNERLRRVLEHIDQHADDALDLETLSGVATFSKFHFHRQFTAVLGLPLYRYIQLVRMKRASWRLAFREGQAVIDIAMDAGYETPDAFARAFRQQFGQTPTAFRKDPDWDSWLEAFTRYNHARAQLMQTPYSADDVTIVEVPATPVAVMPHRGDPARLGQTIQRFIAWRKAIGLHPRSSATFNVFHTDPRATAPDEFRLDLCAATHRTVAPNDAGVENGLIPGGRCARLRVRGSSDDLEAPALYLYREWLPASGEETRDFPIYCERVRFFPDVPENEAITDLYLPLR
ncbi:AraC family transcriptional regulator [Peristeroidobacter agariperforans]|uniref:AraC family transcriptional regulator n=1 Tax=Peristeroidobacter agariperforans TaxID=268404 RepID=UPI00101D526F|nr:AraC family transcriptional regulator [Peristeroidobacter agariperforans]